MFSVDAGADEDDHRQIALIGAEEGRRYEEERQNDGEVREGYPAIWEPLRNKAVVGKIFGDLENTIRRMFANLQQYIQTDLSKTSQSAVKSQVCKNVKCKAIFQSETSTHRPNT